MSQSFLNSGTLIVILSLSTEYFCSVGLTFNLLRTHMGFLPSNERKATIFTMFKVCLYFSNLDPVSKSDITIWGQIYWLDIVYIIQSYICVSHSTSETYIQYVYSVCTRGANLLFTCYRSHMLYKKCTTVYNM
jgi:hypothetical protein